MITADSRLSCLLDGLSVEAREEQRSQKLRELGLLETGSIPVFDEATQMATHFLDIPLCVLGVMHQEQEYFKAAVGLSRLGLMNELAAHRQLSRLESFSTHVVDSRQVLVVPDTHAHSAFAHSYLTHQYGIRAYLGVPLVASNGVCIGSLAVMDLMPREFGVREIEYLQLTARWIISELERQVSSQRSPQKPEPTSALPLNPGSHLANQLRVDLLSQLTQELRTPLTSVMGMASVLIREIYGPLTDKQKEYLDIIHQSGQYLLALVNEILELSALKDTTDELKLSSVDIEMLCQQAINTLEQAAQRREQKIRLSVEPGRRVWLLDRDKMRQMIYHLLFSLLLSSNAGSIVRLHVSRKVKNLNIAVWVSHPWLGDGVSYAESYQSAPVPIGVTALEASYNDDFYFSEFDGNHGHTTMVNMAQTKREPEPPSNEYTDLGIQLCRILAEIHGGQLTIQNTLETGVRYVVSLPQSETDELL
ncbi:MAG TPA: GAF domain-containing sensor histidine kinase [Leptolyngbyaceae cyanobacterium M33_DOE_097]|uniref:histidine kinase n=1 Tax=Oscillatoriales cyanobacterium SpSt-418 TaxID=2282169 RepID=A0A7C3KEM6_9CYAN|nr:GAF domain-containing sensor histidine kinase [Leptolyngbyaceae cyanobacterium M33_DOE_097]